MVREQKHHKRHWGFTLIEMMAVVIIILVMLGVTAITFANSRPSVRVKRDAAHTVSFMRNMWDRTKAESTTLILEPNFEDGSLAYTNPDSGIKTKADFDSGAHVIGIKLNDRLYSAGSTDYVAEDNGYSDGYEDNSIYISEGRGLTRMAVVFGVPTDEDDDQAYEHLYMCSLNLITGKGHIVQLTMDELSQLVEASVERSDLNSLERVGPREQDNAEEDDDD